jgi:hypothetical protein
MDCFALLAMTAYFIGCISSQAVRNPLLRGVSKDEAIEVVIAPGRCCIAPE